MRISGNTGKWLFRLLPLLLLAGITAITFHGNRKQGIRINEFISEWSATLAGISESNMLEIAGSDPIYTRHFANGEWIVAHTEYACSDGAGFDATVFRDSNGLIQYQKNHHFCGYEGLSSELAAVSADSLPAFYEFLTNVCIMEKINESGQQGDGD